MPWSWFFFSSLGGDGVVKERARGCGESLGGKWSQSGDDDLRSLRVEVPEGVPQFAL